MTDSQPGSNAPPLVTVQTITYNHAAYIQHCLDGVLMQRTNFPFEHVIGEDCSTDGTRGLVQAHAKRHSGIVRLITSESNVGARANVRRTRAAARGKYIAYCEGDDSWHDPCKLQRQVDWMEAHPECGLVHTDVDFEDVATGNVTRNVHRERGDLNTQLDIFHSLINCTYRIITCTACVRRETMLQAVAQPSYASIIDALPMGDTPLWLELSRISRIDYLDLSTATYRILPESLSRSGNPLRQLRFYLGMIRLRVHYMKVHGLSADFCQQVLEAMCRPRLTMAAAKGDLEAIEELSEALIWAKVHLGLIERCYRTFARVPMGGLLVRVLSLVPRVLNRFRHRVYAS
jgi:glycosyltransferase involved in cell wall biosynthesis